MGILLHQAQTCFRRKIIYWNRLLRLGYYCLVLLVIGCGGGSEDDKNNSSTGSISSSSQEVEIAVLGFDTVSGEAWDETAVRKVLHMFAFGGHATDQQIIQWSNMTPVAAIVEMLTLDNTIRVCPRQRLTTMTDYIDAAAHYVV